MLTITQRQMDQLAAPMMRKIERDCLQHLKQADPARFDKPETDALRQEVRRHVAESRHFDFQYDASILEYVRICLRHHTDHLALMERAEVRAIFEDPDLREAEKLYLVENAICKP